MPIDLAVLPVRADETHKGDFGRALLIGGSVGMGGAVGLAGMAALRCGAGLVTLATPDECLQVVASFEPSYMTVPLPSDGEGRIADRACDVIEPLAESATCVAIGPGLGRSQALTELVARLYRTLAGPLVVDADGLNALAAKPQDLAQAGGPRVLTPHPGEFRRLAQTADGSRQDQEQAAHRLARESDAVIVLKGHHTYVTDGTRHDRNATGNPGMATGGAGDVLTGIITALICQSLSPLDAARLGVHLHGLAGDLAAERLGQESLIASDLVHFVGPAIAKHRLARG